MSVRLTLRTHSAKRMALQATYIQSHLLCRAPWQVQMKWNAVKEALKVDIYKNSNYIFYIENKTVRYLIQNFSFIIIVMF